MTSDEGNENGGRGLAALRVNLTVTRRPVADVAASVLAVLEDRISSAHHLEGASYVPGGDEPSVLAFQLRHGTFNAPTPESPQLALQAIKYDLGNCITIAAFDRKLISRVWLSAHDPIADVIAEKRPLLVLFFRARRVVAAFDARSVAEEARWKVIDEVQSTAERSSMVRSVAFWATLADEPMWSHLLTRDDRAEMGWAIALGQRLRTIRDEVKALSGGLEDAQDLPAPFLEAVEILRTSVDPLSALFDLVEAEMRAHGARRLLLRTDNPVLDRLESRLVELASVGAFTTRCGRVLPSFDSEEITPIPLDLEAVERAIGFEQYWVRIATGARWGWSSFVRGDDIPISAQELFEGLQDVELVENAGDAHDTTNQLLAEAVASRQWTIPPGAVVDLAIGPFVRIEVREVGPAVVFVCRNARSEFMPFVVFPKTGAIGGSIASVFDDAPHGERVQATIHVLLASIVRDFWVVEERSQVFARAPEPLRRKRAATVPTNGAPAIVYLPRVRYLNAPDVGRAARELVPADRRAHTVAPHLRRSASASPHQRALAAIHGYSVPEGFTFVRPHQRGGEEREVVFRSRSALRVLLDGIDGEIAGAASRDADDWFAFETAVRDRLAARGFVYESVRPLPDTQGSRIVVSDGLRLGVVHARRSPRVGVNAIEAIMADAARAPAGALAVMIIPGTATDAAGELAARTGVEIIQLGS